MNDPLTVASVGTGGTVLALTLPEMAAIFAGTTTGLWMLYQLARAISQDFRKK